MPARTRKNPETASYSGSGRPKTNSGGRGGRGGRGRPKKNQAPPEASTETTTTTVGADGSVTVTKEKKERKKRERLVDNNLSHTSEYNGKTYTYYDEKKYNDAWFYNMNPKTIYEYYKEEGGNLSWNKLLEMYPPNVKQIKVGEGDNQKTVTRKTYRRLRTALIKHLQGVTPISMAKAQKKKAVKQSQKGKGNEDAFKGIRTEKLVQMDNEKYNKSFTLDYWKNRYNNDIRKVRYALIHRQMGEETFRKMDDKYKDSAYWVKLTTDEVFDKYKDKFKVKMSYKDFLDYYHGDVDKARNAMIRRFQGRATIRTQTTGPINRDKYKKKTTEQLYERAQYKARFKESLETLRARYGGSNARLRTALIKAIEYGKLPRTRAKKT